MKRVFLIMSMIAGMSVASVAHSDPYDDCVLQHMGSASNRDAVNALKTACIGKTSVAIPNDGAQIGVIAQVGNYHISTISNAEYGLLVTVNNTIPWNITQVVLSIMDRQTQKVSNYVVDNFFGPLSPGVVAISGPGDADKMGIVKTGTTREMFVPIRETAADFGKRYTWSILPTKGIPTEPVVPAQASECKDCVAIPPSACTYALKVGGQSGDQAGDCWRKMKPYDKHMFYHAMFSGWYADNKLISQMLLERNIALPYQQPYKQIVGYKRLIEFFDRLYADQENRSIDFSDALLLARDPENKEIPDLAKMFRKGESPILEGYLVEFIPPNKVVIAEHNSSVTWMKISKQNGWANRRYTVTLLGVNADNNKSDSFMSKLLNIKSCNGLQQKPSATDQLYIDNQYPELNVVVRYPGYDESQARYFDGSHNLSGIVMLKPQTVCHRGTSPALVSLDEILLTGVKKEDRDNYGWPHSSAGINLNEYLIVNGFAAADPNLKNDPRSDARNYGFDKLNFPPTTEGIQQVMTIGK